MSGDPIPSEPGRLPLPEVAVLGAAAVDWVARVEALPPLDGITFVDEYLPFTGGSGGNVAEGIACLGHQVRFLGSLGDDDGGKLLWNAFEQAGVDTSCIRIEKDRRSASTFIAVDRHGQRLIFALGGTALFDQASDIKAAFLESIKILFIADAFPEVALKAISCLPGEAKVVFNPGGLMCSYGLDVLRPILENCDLFILSRAESVALSGLSDPPEACEKLAHCGAGTVVLTLGEDGAMVFDGQKTVSIPAVPVPRVIDTTGAGDAFSAGLVSGLLEGLSPIEAARLGCAVAARKIQHFGARQGLPKRGQVQYLR